MPKPFDWDRAWMSHRDRLPHLRQDGVVYFVTFRLADSLPADVLHRMRAERDAWLAAHPPPHTPAQGQEYRKIWTARIERLLDAGHGECQLKDPACRSFLEATMRHDDGMQYQLGPFIIMPNHAHVLVHLLGEADLSDVTQAWKSVSAHRINERMARSGQLWQEESFDHIVRDDSAMARLTKYIRDNPVHLPAGTYTLGCGSVDSK